MNFKFLWKQPKHLKSVENKTIKWMLSKIRPSNRMALAVCAKMLGCGGNASCFPTFNVDSLNAFGSLRRWRFVACGNQLVTCEQPFKSVSKHLKYWKKKNSQDISLSKEKIVCYSAIVLVPSTNQFEKEKRARQPQSRCGSLIVSFFIFVFFWLMLFVAWLLCMGLFFCDFLRILGLFAFQSLRNSSEFFTAIFAYFQGWSEFC